METPGDGNTGRLYVAPRTSIPGRARWRVTARPEACELDVYTAATVRQTIGALRASVRRVGTGQYSHGQRDGGRPYSPSDEPHAAVPRSTCTLMRANRVKTRTYRQTRVTMHQSYHMYIY